jgi:hypothetical protein
MFKNRKTGRLRRPVFLFLSVVLANKQQRVDEMRQHLLHNIGLRPLESR